MSTAVAAAGVYAEGSLRVTLIERIAVVELDNPPVNALFDVMRDGIASLMRQLDADDAVAAILFVGAGRSFCAGVDLKRTALRTEPFFLHAALDAMDSVGKLLFAAVHGPALGGGLELAMSCHYRLAGPAARFGLPEVEVGLIPGACGTQRLPRLVPVERALGVAALGDILDRREASQLGLVDDTTDAADFRQAAVEWARSHLDTPVRRTRDLAVIGCADIDTALARAKTRAEAERPAETAPLQAMAAVRAACKVDFDAGVEVERRLVTECKNSDEAKAMRYLFFAERAAGRTGVAASKLPAIAVSGSQAAKLIGVSGATGAGPMGSGAVTLAAIRHGEIADATVIAVLPATRSGVVELAVLEAIGEDQLGAIVRFLKPLGRAVVIGRGVRLGDRLLTAARASGFGGREFDAVATTALADTGMDLIAAGAAASAGEIDLVCCGLGFPRSKGGPMYIRGRGEA